MSTEAPRSRPGGRSARVRQQIIDAAVVELMSPNGDHSYQSIATRAGVNKTTIYRNWPDRSELILEAINQAVATQQTPELLGDLRTDLRRVAEVASVGMTSDTARALAANMMLASLSDERARQAMEQFWRVRFDHLAEGSDYALLLAEGLHLIKAQISFEAMLMARTLTEQDLDRFVDVALKALSVR